MKKASLCLVLLCCLGFFCPLPAQSPAADSAKKSDSNAFDAKSVYLELFKSGKLFDKREYKTVRAAVCKAFEQAHRVDIKEGLGKDAEAMNEWFAKNVDIKEEFYTALDENYDDLIQAISLFRNMWKANPEAVKNYPNLAIAVAVVWDKPGEDLYDYRGHQVRTHSLLPAGVNKITALENFKYFVDQAKAIQAKEPAIRIQFLPWEFQVYLVDTRTPIQEREWAVQNYLPKRQLIGKAYFDCKYDTEMLQSGGEVCKLAGKPYTLESLKNYGGVCAMQADFAARVAKSLAVPAAYVGGESATLDLHAWVMYVQVTGVQKDKVNFLLESEGRYGTDNYYTGNLKDPQTGQQILDRDMERRLSAVAQDRVGKRLSDLNMRIYQVLLDELKAQKKRIAFLDANLKLCHYNEGAWLEFAEMVKSGDLSNSSDLKSAVLSHWNSMLVNFAKYPDFTWKVSPDLALINKETKPERNSMYKRLIDLYEKGNRPDLACDARLKLAEFQQEDKQYSQAAVGLNQTIQKFPNEGRYIPKLMKALNEACGKYPEGKAYLTKAYINLVTNIKPKRGAEPTKYALAMYKEAVEFLEKDKKNDQIVKQIRNQMNQLSGR
ncbi:hypothetical protein KIH39_21840 [Telmatocola sphagniphila]|uniref:Tetratricopeptide repeat protein n=1 Tax=Telmatocola sphagniphila TaxID=1123043 RepID=A0A8E6EXB2_9BACT|nr:hypothetical protein [Telmatocola sphagniphila]QVL31463.1 hypothetical protein KIH39_21840 [Telmatocola sphagniphila]